LELHLGGSNTINAPRQTVYDRLTNPEFLASGLPDSVDVRVVDGSTIEAKVKVRVAVVSSTLKVRLSVSGKAPPEKATLQVEGSGSGSTLRITSNFTLTGDSPTKMEWTADAEITGVMAGLGSTLLKGFATKKVDEIFSGITNAIERSTT
jgi:carbon monoxide dehydrogenase subunit G